MDKKHGIHPIIIGGWAVYAHVPVLGSKDIDILIPTYKDLNDIILEVYFPAHGFMTKKGKNFEPLYYYKLVDSKHEIITDIFIGQSEKEDEYNLGMRFPWSIVFENSIQKQIKDLVFYTPRLELLIVLKMIAAVERNVRYDKTGDANLPSKIWKDYHDIAALVKNCEINDMLLQKFVLQTHVTLHVDEFLNKFDLDYGDILSEFDISYRDIEKHFQHDDS